MAGGAALAAGGDWSLRAPHSTLSGLTDAQCANAESKTPLQRTLARQARLFAFERSFRSQNYFEIQQLYTNESPFH